jgi:hypothetical protein
MRICVALAASVVVAVTLAGCMRPQRTPSVAEPFVPPVAPPPNARTVVEKDLPVLPAEIGINRTAVRVSVPANHRLIRTYRVWRDGRFDAEASFAISEWDRREQQQLIVLGVFDPDVLLETPTRRLALLMPPRARVWMELPDRKTSSIIGGVSDPLSLNQDHDLLHLEVGGEVNRETADGMEIIAPPAPIEVLATVRIEPMTAEELASGPLAGAARVEPADEIQVELAGSRTPRRK